MATGPATAQLLEVNWSSTTYTDLSSRVVTYEPVTIRQGRGSRFDDVQPGTMAVVLDNSDGALTPDNPLSDYYPNVIENKAIRWAVTPPGGASTRRFWGRIVSIEPDSPSGIMAWSRVRLTCVDRLGILTRKVLRCDQVERALYHQSFYSATADIFPFTTVKQRPTTLANKGNGGGTAEVFLPLRRRGSATSVQDPDGIMLDGAVELRASGSGVGPVIHVDMTIAPTSIVMPFRTADRVQAGKGNKYVMHGVTTTGDESWSIQLADNAGQTDLRIYDQTGGYVELVTEFAPVGDGEPGDDQWYALWLYIDAGIHYALLVRQKDDEIVAFLALTNVDIDATRGIVLGGKANRRTRGKQTRCVNATYGAVTAVESATVGLVGTSYLQPDGVVSVATRLTNMESYAGTSVTETGTADRDVWLKRTTGRTPFDVLAEMARTTGSLFRAEYDGATNNIIEWIHADQLRSTTVAATIDAEADLDASSDFPWRRGIDTRPNEVTASWPGGETTVVGIQTLGVVEDSVDTCAANRDQARSVASARIYVGKGLAPQSLAVDLTHAQTDLWADVLALRVGDRIRVTSLPSTYYGRTYADLYVLGWTEEHDQAGSRFTFEVEPADDPAPDGIVSTARVDSGLGAITVTSGTAVGTTSTGTIVATTASGAALSNSAADYPMDFDWAGERVTVTSAPASSTSPQTLTITARGVAPTVARSHATGDALRPWDIGMVAF